MVKRKGFVYLGESTRSDGSKKIYTGITRRPVRTRWREHINSTKLKKGRTWISKGEYFRPMGAFCSNNPEKAEKTIKNLPAYQKKYLTRGAAMRYKRKKAFW